MTLTLSATAYRARISRYALLTALTLSVASHQAYGQTFSQVMAYDRPAQYGVLRTNDILVPMRDGFRLTCDLYQPMGPNGQIAPGTFPSFVKDYTGYGRRDDSTGGSDNVTQTLAAKGYNVIWCNARGSQGRYATSPAPNSIGLINPWSEQEQQDNYDLIEWLAVQPWSNGRVGQTGGSYGGISTWLVATRQQPPSLKAIVPITGSFDGYRQFAYPGGIRSGDLRGLWPTLCSALTGDPTCSARVTADWAFHPNFDAYWQERNGNLSAIQIPTLYLAGHQDIFAEATDPVISKLGDEPNFSLVLGPWAHENPWTTTNVGIPVGVLLAFFDRHLAGIGGTPKLPKYSAYESPVKSGSDRWRSFSSWPPADAAPVRYALSADGSLQQQGGVWGLMSYNPLLGGLSFDTAPFNSERTVAGPIEVNLQASFASTDMNLFARVDQVDGAGNVVDMGYGTQIKMSHLSSDSMPPPIVPGLLYPVKLSIPSKFWTLEPGMKLRLTIKSTDSTSLEAPPPSAVTLLVGPDGSYIKLRLRTP